MNPWKPSLVLLLVMTGSFAGCLGGSKTCTSGGSTDFAGQELRVLDHGAWDSAYAFVKPLFENQTGAKLVQIKGEDAGAALKQAVDSKGRPVADVLYGIDNALFGQAAREGIFEPYASPRLPSINATLVGLDDFRTNGLLLATPVDHGYISVNYDRKYSDSLAANQLPATLEDLTREEWASELVVEDPRLSSPGLGFLIATVATFGERGAYTYRTYWTDLLEGGALVAKDWTEAYVVHFSAGYGQYEAGFAGDRGLVVSYTTSPAAEAFFSDGHAPSVSLEPERGVFHQVETVGILKCTRHLPLAQAFVDLLLGPEFQNATAANMAVYPVVRDATVPSVFQEQATDPSDLVPAPFSSADLDRLVPRWLDNWTEIYQAERA
jgi:thiamine transport system substrate-binding protein